MKRALPEQDQTLHCTNCPKGFQRLVAPTCINMLTQSAGFDAGSTLAVLRPDSFRSGDILPTVRQIQKINACSTTVPTGGHKFEPLGFGVLPLSGKKLVSIFLENKKHFFADEN